MKYLVYLERNNFNSPKPPLPHPSSSFQINIFPLLFLLHLFSFLLLFYFSSPRSETDFFISASVDLINNLRGPRAFISFISNNDDSPEKRIINKTRKWVGLCMHGIARCNTCMHFSLRKKKKKQKRATSRNRCEFGVLPPLFYWRSRLRPFCDAIPDLFTYNEPE